jgi:hypothetical protein
MPNSSTMKLYNYLIACIFLFSTVKDANSQLNKSEYSLSLSFGNFIIDKNNLKGIWTAVDFSKRVFKNTNQRFSLGGGIFFENGGERPVTINPTQQQFINESFYHESNTGLNVILSYYPIKKYLKGFFVSGGPLIVYSIRTYEKRSELITYSPGLTIRMTELASDNKILSGYRITTGYDFTLYKRWLVGVRADFIQYSTRDLNSLLAGRIGYLF